MEPVTTVIVAGVAIAVTAALGYAVKKYREIQQKNKEIEALRSSLNAYAETYAFEAADEELARACRKRINELFRNGINEEFSKYQTVEEKKEFARRIVKELADCMRVKVENVVIEDLGPYTRGLAVPDCNPPAIFLNEVLLVADPVGLVKAMCHELKHCVQYQSLTDNVWGYSPQRVAQFLYSWEKYVPCDSKESYEAYSKQIIEIDANKYIDRIFNV